MNPYRRCLVSPHVNRRASGATEELAPGVPPCSPRQ